jgi:hypothetical protein
LSQLDINKNFEENENKLVIATGYYLKNLVEQIEVGQIEIKIKGQ